VEGVAKVGEDDGLPVAVPAELPVRGQGPPEAGDRLGVVAELTVRVAEAVPRQRLAVAVADGAVEVQGPLAVLDGALVISEVGESVKPGGERCPDPRLVAATVDRIAFNAHILGTGTESYRLRTSSTTARRKRAG
jgi:hypothetical protein